MNVAKFFDENIAKFSPYDLVVFGGVGYKNVDLHSASCRFASALTSLGVQAGAPVFVCLSNTPEMVSIVNAVWKAGAINVPIHYSTNPVEFGRLGELIVPTVLITTQLKYEEFKGHFKNGVNRIEHVIILDAAVEAAGEVKIHSYKKLVEKSPAMKGNVVRSDEDSAIILFTSGSTGKPKGLMLSHANLFWIQEYIRLTPEMQTTLPHCCVPGTVFLFYTSVAHAAGITNLFAAVKEGTTMVMTKGWDSDEVLNLIEKHRIQVLDATPTCYIGMVNSAKFDKTDVSSLKACVVGAAPISNRNFLEIEKKLGRPILFQCYGLSETSSLVCMSTSSPQRPRESVGKPLHGTRVEVIGAGGEVLGPEMAGQVRVFGKHIFTGYLGQANEENKNLVDGWLLTSDVGKFDVDGNLFLLGREKEMISQGGVKIFPAEVEATLIKHPKVKQVVVIGIPDDLLGEYVGAFFVAKNESDLSMQELRDYAKTHLSKNKLPRLFRILEVLPLNAAHKIDKKTLLADFLIQQAALTETSFAKDLSGLSALQKIKQIKSAALQVVSEVIGISKTEIGADRPLSEIGFHSLHAVEIARELSRIFGRKFPTIFIFNFPTINAMAQAILDSVSMTPESASSSASSRQSDSARKEDIAIIGIGFRFPGDKSDPESLWRSLAGGEELLSKIPVKRWGEQYWGRQSSKVDWFKEGRGGFLSTIDQFDNEYFGLPQLDAKSMDPQQRLLLEVTSDAFDRAGISHESLLGKAVGTYIGITGSDYGFLESLNQCLDPDGQINAYSGLGTTACLTAGRVSYLFGLEGPSLALDTACSSGLVAVHLACQAIKAGECELAVAGASNVILSPLTYMALAEQGFLSPEFKCKAFDSSADGYVRSEGAAVVILKRLSSAVRDGDRIWAVVRGSAVNQDGRSISQVAPNGRAQEKVIQKALSESQVKPGEISFMETHGTGTLLGDPIELNAIKNQYCQNRDPSNPLYLGAVKTNMGHLEAVAGLAGLIKVVLCLNEKKIPPNLHVKKLTPHFDWKNTSVVVPTALTDWKTSQKKLIAAVSSFGVSGTNAHIVVEEAPVQAKTEQVVERPNHILCISAKSAESLKKLVIKYLEFTENLQDRDLADICFSANSGRSHFKYRLAIICESMTSLKTSLQNFLKTEEESNIPFVNSKLPQPIGEVAFLYSGQGTIYKGMGKDLYQTMPAFKRALDFCADYCRKRHKIDLIAVLFASDAKAPDIFDLRYTQIAVTAIQYALVKMWSSFGIASTICMGHSAGEYMAAVDAGIMKIEDVLTLVIERGHLLYSSPDKGKMIQVIGSRDLVEKSVLKHSKLARIAAYNGADLLMVSGFADAVDRISTDLKAQKLKVIPFQGSSGFAPHSPVVESIVPAFRKVLESLSYSRSQKTYVSAWKGKEIAEGVDTAYWVDQFAQPVHFSDALKVLDGKKPDFTIEIGPHATLLPLLHRALTTDPERCVTSLQKSSSEWISILNALKAFYLFGGEVNWKSFDADFSRRRRDVPTYQFDRKTFWLDKLSGSISIRQGEIADCHVLEEGKQNEPAVPVLSRIQAPAAMDIGQVKAELKKWILSLVGNEKEQLLDKVSLTDLGFDSLMRVDLRSRIKKKTGVDVPPELIFANFDFKALLEYVMRGIEFKHAPVVTKNVWTSHYKARANPKFRLLCLHHMAASAAMFASWQNHFDSSVEVVPIELPGHGYRYSDPFITDFSTLISELSLNLRDFLGIPFAVIGHSMGANIGYEWIVDLKKNHGIAPRHFYASAADARTFHHDKGDLSFLHVSPELTKNKEYMDIILPIAEADVELSNSYRECSNVKIDCPITAFGANSDTLADREVVNNWAKLSNSGFASHFFKGDHMFIVEHFQAIIEIIKADVLSDIDKQLSRNAPVKKSK